MAPETVWMFWRGENPLSLLGFESRVVHPVAYSVHVYVRARAQRSSYISNAGFCRQTRKCFRCNKQFFVLDTYSSSFFAVPFKVRSMYKLVLNLFIV